MKKYLLGLLLIAFVVVPVIGKAATSQELQCQIYSLQHQLWELNGKIGAEPAQPAACTGDEELQCQIYDLQHQLWQLGGSVGPEPAQPSFCRDNTIVPAPCPVITRNLTIGSKGPDVTALQQYLIEEGLLDQDGPSGYFGNLTKAAVQAWQKANNVLPNNGFFGPASRAILDELCGSIPPLPCVGEGQSLGAVVPGNNHVCCAGLVAQPAPNGIVGSRGTCVRPGSSVVINSVSGPTSLNVSQTGTWSVRATGPVNTNLTYSVEWGDNQSKCGDKGGCTSAVSAVTQTSTFNHSYSQAGTYTVRFWVYSNPVCPPCVVGTICVACVPTNNQPAQASMTVVVGNVGGQPTPTVIPESGKIYLDYANGISSIRTDLSAKVTNNTNATIFLAKTWSPLVANFNSITRGNVVVDANGCSSPFSSAVSHSFPTVTDNNNNSYLQLPSGQSVDYTVSRVCPVNQMFAGTYNGKLWSLNYRTSLTDNGNSYRTVNIDFFTKGSQYIVGEKGPWISQVTQGGESGAQYIIYGERLDTGSSQVYLNGDPHLARVISRSNSKILFNTSLSAGNYPVYIDSNLGKSNTVTLVISDGNYSIPPMVLRDISGIKSVVPPSIANLSFGVYQVSAQYNLGGYHRGQWSEGLNPGVSGPVWVEFGWPNSPDVDVVIDDENSNERKIYLPAVGSNSSKYGWYYWIASDGSSYYANTSHGPGWPDLSSREALTPKHLARRSPATTQPSITVISPNGGERVYTGRSQTIKWSSANLPSTEKISIQLYATSYDSTYPSGPVMLENIVSNITNTGSYNWMVPDSYAYGYDPNKFQIRVYSGLASKPTASDVSNNPFTIVKGGANLAPYTFISPAGGEVWRAGSNYPIKFSRTTNNVRVTALSKNDPTFARIVWLSGSNNGWSWTIPSDFPSNKDIYLKQDVFNNDASIIGTVYSNSFTIAGGNSQPSILVSWPNGGETFKPGQQVLVHYSISNFPRPIRVQIQLNKGATYPNGPYNPVGDATAYLPTTGNYTFTIPASAVTGNDYSFMINSDYPSTETSAHFQSNNFTITSLTQPTNTLSITPSMRSVSSGGTVTLNYTTHSNAVSAKLYLACPAGVSAFRGQSGINDCNTFYSFPMIPTGSTYTFTNTSAQSQNVVPNFYEYLADNPNYAHGVSSQITVTPGPVVIPTQTPSITDVKINDLANTWVNGTTKRITWNYNAIPNVPVGLKYRVGLYTDLNGGMWGNSVYVSAGQFSTDLSARIGADYFNKPYYVRVRLVNADNTDYRANGARVEAQSSQTFSVTSTVCAQDVYRCPNGINVPRSGSTCEFVCSSTTATPPVISSASYSADSSQLTINGERLGSSNLYIGNTFFSDGTKIVSRTNTQIIVKYPSFSGTRSVFVDGYAPTNLGRSNIVYVAVPVVTTSRQTQINQLASAIASLQKLIDSLH